jgi:hypothetical protein
MGRILAPILPVSDIVSGIFFVSSIVLEMRSSNCEVNVKENDEITSANIN